MHVNHLLSFYQVEILNHFCVSLINNDSSVDYHTMVLLLLLLRCFSHVRLCDPTDDSPTGSPVPGILQARTLEWVAISFSNAWKWKVKVKSLSRVWLFVTPWTAAYRAPPSMGFSRQEYWNGVPLPSLTMVLKHHKKCVCVCVCVWRGLRYWLTLDWEGMNTT